MVLNILPSLSTQFPERLGAGRVCPFSFSSQTRAASSVLAFLVRWRGRPRCFCRSEATYPFAPRGFTALARPVVGSFFKPCVALTGRGASRGNPVAAFGIRAKLAELPCLALIQTRAASGVLVFWCVGGAGLVVFVGVGQPIRLHHAVFTALSRCVARQFFQARRGSNRAWCKPGQPPSRVGHPGKNWPALSLLSMVALGLIPLCGPSPRIACGGFPFALGLRHLGRLGSAGKLGLQLRRMRKSGGGSRLLPWEVGFFIRRKSEKPRAKAKSKSQDQEPNRRSRGRGVALWPVPPVPPARAP